MSFDRLYFESEVRRLNPEAVVLELSARSGGGMGQWVTWLEMRAFEARFRRGQGRGDDGPAEPWFG